MSCSEPNHDRQIADLQDELAELRRQWQVTHDLWRAGLRAAQRGESAAGIECALSGITA